MERILIVCGSQSDMHIAEKASQILKDFGIEHKIEVASAHRNPEKLEELVSKSPAEVFIAVAGLSAALPGVIASKTVKPVIGVPVAVKLEGLDALLSMMQMPSGIPVATVGVENAKNASHLAAEMLALKDDSLKKKLEEYRKSLKK